MSYSGMKNWLDERLREIRDSGLYKDEKLIKSPQGSQVDTLDGPNINFCANNYLGLADNADVTDAVKNGLDSHGFGMASVRFICGTQDIHRELEERISEFLGTEDTILYNSCFDANAGLFETLLSADDAVISDSLNHASIIDGVRLSKAQRKVFRHSDLDDLEDRLKETQSARFRMIATDGVFSMQGDLARLDEICDLADRYDAIVMVDDSHATGFLASPSDYGYFAYKFSVSHLSDDLQRIYTLTPFKHAYWYPYFFSMVFQRRSRPLNYTNFLPCLPKHRNCLV